MADSDPTNLSLKITGDATSGVQATDQTVAGLAKVEAGTKAVAAASAVAGAATDAAAAQSAAAAKTAADAAGTAAGAQKNLGDISTRTALALAQLKITQDEVNASALKVGASLETTARAMIAIEQSRASDEVAKTREQLEALAAAQTQSSDAVAQGQQDTASAADQLSDTLENQSTQLEDNTQKGHKFIEELGEMRGSRRAAVELFEVLRGGGDTISGLTGLMREFILSTESLASPWALALAGIGLALTGIIAKHSEAKKSTDELDGSTNELATTMGRVKDAATAAITTVLDLQKQQLDYDTRINDALKERATLLKAQGQIDQEQKLLTLQRQFLVDSQGAKSPEDQALLRKRYEAAREDIKGDTTAQSAQLDADQADLESQDAQKKLAEQQKQLRDNTVAAAHAAAQKEQAENALASQGITFDKNGNPQLRNAKGQQVVDDGDPIQYLKNQLQQYQAKIAADTYIGNGQHVAPSQAAESRLAQMSLQLAANEDAFKQRAEAVAMLAKHTPESLAAQRVAVSAQQTTADTASDMAKQKGQVAGQAEQQDALDRAARTKSQNDAEEKQRQDWLRTWRDNELEAQKLLATTQAERDRISQQQEINKSNDKLGVPVAAPEAPRNPYSDALAAMQKRMDELEKQANENPQAAGQLQHLLDYFTAPRTDAKGDPLPSRYDELNGKSQRFEQEQGLNVPASPEDLAEQSKRDLETAKTGQSPQLVKAVNDAETAIKQSGHAELIAPLTGIRDAAQRNAVLLAELAAETDPVLRDILKRLQAAEGSIKSIRNHPR